LIPIDLCQNISDDVTERKYDYCCGQYESVQADQFDGDDIGCDQAGNKKGHDDHKPGGNLLIRKMFLLYSFFHVPASVFLFSLPLITEGIS
jgi:hypothetical protein